MEIKQDELKKGYKQAVFIGIVMIVSVFIHAVIIEFIDRGIINMEVEHINEIEILRYILLGIAFSEFFMIRYMKKVYLSNKTTIKLASKGQFLTPVKRLTNVAIITYALCVSVALYGMFLFIMGGSKTDFYIFMFLSFVYFSVYFPRYVQWEEYIVNKHDG